jgi:3-deoxy-manno-octulosonate cytidylyltransferase (CMP-KDO synthetase)
MKVLGVIPARLGSTRFPRKVLHPWKGKPLIGHVAQAIGRSKLIDQLVVATDSREVIDALVPLGIEVVATARRHRTGSDRVAEAWVKSGGDVIVNIQADSLGLSASTLDRAIMAFMADRPAAFGTLAHRLTDAAQLRSPNAVKVVTDADDWALWFSRYPLPYLQGMGSKARPRDFAFLHHIGVYFFRGKALARYASWRRTPLEMAESLEQLRILEHGERIRVYRTRSRLVTIDTVDDLKSLRRRAKRSRL